jgi:multiple sugar transport system substrate-binding protein
MSISKSKKIFYLGMFLFLSMSVFLFSGCLKEKPKTYTLGLEVWGVFDDSDVFSEINRQYRELNPHIKKLEYKKVSSNLATYEKELTDAIANGNGPDIIFFGNNWLYDHEKKVVPLPDSTAYLAEFEKNFVDVAKDDFTKDNQIYAMPLYCDTLALFYNKDLFNQSGLTSPPETWKELLDYTDYLTLTDSGGNILQSAIALGRSKNPGGINRSSDILTLMMMQEGVDIYDKNLKRAVFNGNSKAVDALDFYTQFALAGSEAYTWNSNMDYSIDSFKNGKTAMMINYSYWKNQLKETSPKLNFATAPMLQQDLNQKVNFANYWGLAVVKNKNLTPLNQNEPVNYTQEDRINEAWKYIKYLTANQIENPKELATFDPTEKYLENTTKPAARKDLIEKQKSDPFIGDFALQALTAKSWIQPKSSLTEEVLIETIKEVITGTKTSRDALNSAASRINNSTQ